MTKPKTTAEEILAGHRQGKGLVWVPPSSIEPIVNPIGLIEGDGSALVLTDLHVPFHDASFIAHCLDVAIAWGIKLLIIGGDLLDCAVYSVFGTDPNNTLEEELSTAESMVKVFTEHFQRVIYCMGNHELRMTGRRVLQRQLEIQRWVRLITPPGVTNLEVTPFEWVEMASPIGTWLIAHPRNSSIIAGRVPNMIAGRSCTDRHVISGHGHLRGLTWADDGRRYSIDSGCCIDISRTEYVASGRSNRPAMQNGAVILKGGKPTLLYPGIDWEAVKKMYS